MNTIRIRYTFIRKEDGHVWQLIEPISCIEKLECTLQDMFENELWYLKARDLYVCVDRNGNDIYENDIVKSGFSIGLVKYSNFVGHMSFSAYYPKGSCFGLTDAEKIGDIYENSELFK